MITNPNPTFPVPQTVEEAERILRTIIEQHPDRRNPKHGIQCVYTSPDDPTHHCLVGQFLWEIGLPCPDPSDDDINGMSVHTLMMDRGYWPELTDEVGNCLTHYQARADRPSPSLSWDGVLD